jgi:hypothetical protein
LDYASQAKRAELVGGFAVVAATVVAAVDMEDILRDDGQGP